MARPRLADALRLRHPRQGTDPASGSPPQGGLPLSGVRAFAPAAIRPKKKRQQAGVSPRSARLEPPLILGAHPGFDSCPLAPARRCGFPAGPPPCGPGNRPTSVLVATCGARPCSPVDAKKRNDLPLRRTTRTHETPRPAGRGFSAGRQGRSPETWTLHHQPGDVPRGRRWRLRTVAACRARSIRSQIRLNS